MTDSAITVYPTIIYESESKAKDAFLDIYFGDGDFDPEKTGLMAGIPQEKVTSWFQRPLFFKRIEKRLQMGAKRRSSMQESLLSSSHDIIDANIVDLFQQSDNGNLILRSLCDLPRRTTAAIREITLVRKSVGGFMGDEYTEALNVKMHDKTKVMNIMGDYTDVKGTALKRTDSGAPQMVGMSLTTALPNLKEDRADG